MTETLTPSPNNNAADLEPKKMAIGFETSRGSVYAYSETGKATRHKTATGEDYPEQDVTVFAALSPEEIEDFKAACYATQDDPKLRRKVYLIERQPDDSALTISDITQVKHPENLYLAISRNGSVIKHVKASIEPELGSTVFEMLRYEDSNGKKMTSRHLGHEVTSIKYDDQ